MKPLRVAPGIQCIAYRAWATLAGSARIYTDYPNGSPLRPVPRTYHGRATLAGSARMHTDDPNGSPLLVVRTMLFSRMDHFSFFPLARYFAFFSFTATRDFCATAEFNPSSSLTFSMGVRLLFLDLLARSDRNFISSLF